MCATIALLQFGREEAFAPATASVLQRWRGKRLQWREGRHLENTCHCCDSSIQGTVSCIAFSRELFTKQSSKIDSILYVKIVYILVNAVKCREYTAEARHRTALDASRAEEGGLIRPRDRFYWTGGIQVTPWRRWTEETSQGGSCPKRRDAQFCLADPLK